MKSGEVQRRAGLQEMMRSFVHAGPRDQWSVHKQMSGRVGNVAVDPRKEEDHRGSGVCLRELWSICFHNGSLTWLLAGGPRLLRCGSHCWLSE